MKIKYLFFLFLLLSAFPFINIFAQNDVQIGKSSMANEYNSKGAKYDYSDPNSINIKVLVWGYVQFPGQYIIPSTSTVNDLLALAGGPVPDAHLDELRLFRINPDSSQTMIKFNYNDLLWNNNLTSKVKIPSLKAGDILLVPGSPRFFLRDYLNLTLQIVATLSSVAVLIITILHYK